MPGGTVEQGETINEALQREIREESGIVCEPEYLTGIYQNLILKDGYGPLEGMRIPPIINSVFTCRYVSGEITSSDESEGARCVTLEEARHMVANPLYVKQFGIR